MQLIADASAVRVFNRWEGNLDGSANPTSVIMDVDKRVTKPHGTDRIGLVAIYATTGPRATA